MNNHFKMLNVMTLILVLSISCTSSDKKIKADLKNNNINSLPPETVEIYGIVQEINDTSQIIFCYVQVDTVFGYGHSTPTVAVGTKLKVRINNGDFIDEKNQNGLIKINMGLYFELKSQKLMSLNNNSSQWSVVNVSQNRHFNK